MSQFLIDNLGVVIAGGGSVSGVLALWCYYLMRKVAQLESKLSEQSEKYHRWLLEERNACDERWMGVVEPMRERIAILEVQTIGRAMMIDNIPNVQEMPGGFTPSDTVNQVFEAFGSEYTVQSQDNAVRVSLVGGEHLSMDGCLCVYVYKRMGGWALDGNQYVTSLEAALLEAALRCYLWKRWMDQQPSANEALGAVDMDALSRSINPFEAMPDV